MKYRIAQDMDAHPPQEDDDGLFLVAKHRDFFVPEPGKKQIPEDPDEVKSNWKKTHWIFNLEAYIHSGVRLALSQEGDFPDRRWDVSQLGFVFVSKKEWRLSKKARVAALGLIEEWNQYLSGDVWGYVIENDGGEEIDSCWGFYGREYCEEEAKSVMAAIAEREKKQTQFTAQDFFPNESKLRTAKGNQIATDRFFSI